MTEWRLLSEIFRWLGILLLVALLWMLVAVNNTLLKGVDGCRTTALLNDVDGCRTTALLNDVDGCRTTVDVDEVDHVRGPRATTPALQDGDDSGAATSSAPTRTMGTAIPGAAVTQQPEDMAENFSTVLLQERFADGQRYSEVEYGECGSPAEESHRVERLPAEDVAGDPSSVPVGSCVPPGALPAAPASPSAGRGLSDGAPVRPPTTEEPTTRTSRRGSRNSRTKNKFFRKSAKSSPKSANAAAGSSFLSFLGCCHNLFPVLLLALGASLSTAITRNRSDDDLTRAGYHSARWNWGLIEGVASVGSAVGGAIGTAAGSAIESAIGEGTIGSIVEGTMGGVTAAAAVTTMGRAAPSTRTSVGVETSDGRSSFPNHDTQSYIFQSLIDLVLGICMLGCLLSLTPRVSVVFYYDGKKSATGGGRGENRFSKIVGLTKTEAGRESFHNLRGAAGTRAAPYSDSDEDKEERTEKRTIEDGLAPPRSRCSGFKEQELVYYSDGDEELDLLTGRHGHRNRTTATAPKLDSVFKGFLRKRLALQKRIRLPIAPTTANVPNVLSATAPGTIISLFPSPLHQTHMIFGFWITAVCLVYAVTK